MKKYNHIIWDFNGTLLDDSKLCVEILNQLLKKRNMPNVTHQQYQQTFDFPVKDYYQKLGFDFSKESYNDIAAEYLSIYDSRRFECQLQPDAIKVLQFFADNNITQSVLSAYQQKRLEEAIDFFDLRPFFTKLFGMDDDYAHSKLENGIKLMNKFVTTGESVLFIGDTTHDFDVAKQIGANSILIPSGHQTEQRLRQCPVLVLDSISCLLTLQG